MTALLAPLPPRPARRDARPDARRAARRAARRRGWLAMAGLLLPIPAAGQRGAPPPAPDATPAIVAAGEVDPRKDVNFSAIALPTTVYVGQQVTYQIGVFLSPEVARRLRRNPEFIPPDVRSMLAYDLPSPVRALRRDEGGRSFDVHVFQRALFPLTAGTHVLAPARLTYALPLSNTFFSREESHAARTGAVTVVAREPPLAGRPAGYDGAVGRIALSARVDSAAARIGDPVSVIVSVRGVGNVSLFPRPRLALAWGDAVNGAERVSIDSGPPLVQGRKDFEWIVTPRQEGTLEVPAVRYPFWNPYTEAYEVAVTDPLPLRVDGGTLATRVAVAVDTVPRLALRARYRGPLSPPRSTAPTWWALLAIVPIPALALGARQRPRRPRSPRPLGSLQRLATTPGTSPAMVRRAFASAIMARTSVGARAMTDASSLVRRLRHAGVTAATAERAALVLAEIDRATYGRAGAPPAPDLARRAAGVFADIDAEAIPTAGVRSREAPPPGGSRWSLVVAMTSALAVGGMAAAIAAPSDTTQDGARFHRAVAAYDRGDFRAAMRDFRDLAVRVPRAADAWANLGTAAWYANDTAAAAIGWQRALRLEPLAGDMRTRLEATPGFRAGLAGDVPPIPVDAAAALGTIAWVVGWAGLAWALAHRRREGRRLAWGAIGTGALLGMMTVALSEALSGRHRVIVLEADRLRASPALGAEVSSEVMAGEGAREVAAQGVWSRVRFADGRSGWMESRRLASLDLARLP